MSRRKDYTRFSNKTEPKNEHNIPVTTGHVVIDENAKLEDSDASLVDVVIEETIAKMPKPGVVVDCLKLNVREAPNANADVVCVINASTKFVVDEAESTDDFYAVCTESGAEGYCMKKFVQILP